MHLHPGLLGLKRADRPRMNFPVHLGGKRRLSIDLEQPRHGNSKQPRIFFQEGMDHRPVMFFERAKLAAVELLLGNLPMRVANVNRSPEASENKLPPG